MFKSLKKIILAFVGCISLNLLSGCSFGPKIFKAELNFSEMTLSVDSKKQIAISKVTYGDREVPSTNYSYTWTSSDVTVATVEPNGYVTAADAGTAEIVANISVVGYVTPIKAKCTVTVVDDNPVSVTINKKSVNTQKGKTFQLSAVVEHCAVKAVTWESDNPLISVDNLGIVSVSSEAEVGTVANIKVKSTFDPNAFDTCVVTVIEKPINNSDYTIMYYFCGSTLENDPDSRRSYADPGLISDDIKEILSVDIPDNVKVIIETGGTTKWALSSRYIEGATSISSKRLQRWEVVNHKIKLIETLPTNYMADQQSFESFVEWGISDYGAPQMGIVISGHGGGIAGCAYDDNYKTVLRTQNTLNTTEIAGALETAYSVTKTNKLSWIGFDCCLMGCADIASVLTKYFDYMVASQETELGTGWVHDSYLKLIADDPYIDPLILLTEVVDSFIAFGDKNYCDSDEPCLQQLSILDLSKVDSLTESFNNYVTNSGSNFTTYTVYKNAFKACYNSFGESCYGLGDFYSFLDELDKEFTSISTTDIRNSINDLVLYTSHCSNYKFEPCGVDVFFPYSIDRKSSLQVTKNDYTGDLATKFTPYQELCLKYGSFDY